MIDEPDSGGAEGPNLFPETSVSLYRRMVSENPTDSDSALEEFFQRYWYPMYAFMRAQGADHNDASDLVQGFVAN